MTRQVAVLACIVLAALAGCDGGPLRTPGAGILGDPVRGQALLATYHCGTCHSIPGVAASRAVVASSLEGFGRRSYIAGRVPNEPSQLARWIVDPAAVVPGTLMPAMGVSEADARDMAAYLGRLQ